MHSCRFLGYFTVCLFAAAVVGCTPDAYKRDADRQVYKLIKEREKQTLDYKPEVTAETTTQPTIPPKAYSTLPLTPVPPKGRPSIEPAAVGIEYGPLGPENLFETPLPRQDMTNDEQAEVRSRARLLYGPPTTAGNTVALGLFDSIGYAVQHSRQYQDRMEQVYTVALDVTLQRHLFTPRPFAQTGLRYTGGQEDVGYRSALAITNRVGVRQQLPLGGEIVAQGLFDFVNALNGNVADGENAQLALRASVPLLRGAGLTNLEPLISSERQLIYAVRTFEDYRRSFAVDISSRYFRLLTAQQALRNRYLNYRSFIDLVDRTQALFAAGRVTKLEVQRAQQSLLTAEDDLNESQESLDNQLDSFKVFLGMPVDQGLDVVPVEVEVTVPEIDSPQVVNLALQYRLDLQTARDRIDDARRGVGVAQNGLLPDLTVDGGASIGNRNETPGRSIDERTTQYDVGVLLDLPIDRLAERNVYRRSLINLEATRRSAVNLEEEILADVRASIRAIRSAQLSLEIQRQGIDLARRRLDFANESLLTGRTTNSRDSVEAQNDILDAQDRYERARADLQIEILTFLRNSGTLRVDSTAGTLGLALDRAGGVNVGPMPSGSVGRERSVD